MPKELDAAPVFEELKKIFKDYADQLDLVHDIEGNYYLDTHHIMKNKKPLFFGAVQVKKNHVSYHLMPVYQEPKLLDSISDTLKKKMQGKSCFNFKKVEPELFEELAELTKAGYEHYSKEGFVEV